jgi:hypothetical protein
MHPQTAILLLLLLYQPAAGQTPRAVITGPKESRPGSLVVLDATESQGLGRVWLLAISPEPTSFLPVESGLKVIFASPTPGDYTFVLVVSGTNANGGPMADMATHTVTLLAPRPPPVPPVPPTPPPGPDPPQPPETTGVAYVIVIRRNQELTADQAEVLIRLRTWSDARQQQVSQLEFDPDTSADNGQMWAAKVPSGESLPYWFLSRQRTGATGVAILQQGPLPATLDAITGAVEEVLR